jgi:hypothetical protein
MKRQTSIIKITATNSATTCPAIDMRDVAFGAVRVPTSVTSIEWYGARYKTYSATESEGNQTGPRGVVSDNAGDAVTSASVAAGEWVPIPDECMGLPFVIPVIDQATGEMIVALKD